MDVELLIATSDLFVRCFISYKQPENPGWIRIIFTVFNRIIHRHCSIKAFSCISEKIVYMGCTSYK